jgi:hypothetical protein
VEREKLRACCDRMFSTRFVVIFWKARAGRDVDLEVGGFVAVDGGEGAEKHAGNVGESGGAARGDASAGEKFVEGGEGVVDALGILEVTGVLGKFRGEVFGVGRLRGRVAGTPGGFGIEDAGGALAALGGAVLAAFVGWSWVRRCGLHGRSFLDFFENLS